MTSDMLAKYRGVFSIHKDNTILGAWYICLLGLSMLAYSFSALFRAEGYNPGMYREAYIYLMLYDFILFTVLALFWKTHSQDDGPFQQSLNLVAGMIIMSLSSLPIIMALFLISGLQLMNVLLALLIKPLWGLALLGLQRLLQASKPGWQWSRFSLALFIFAVLVIGSLLAYCTVEFRMSVVTTLYDRDILAVFYLNPLLSLAGLVYAQAGGGSQMGNIPYYACTGFWGLTAVLLNYRAGRCRCREMRRDHDGLQ